MADELRLIFIILGALALGALLLHGLWTVRKNSGQPKHRYYQEDEKDSAKEDGDGFDEFGVGKVKVVKSARANVSKEPVPVATERPQVTRQTGLFDEQQEPQLNFSALDEQQAEAADVPAETVDDATTSTEETASEVLILYVLLPEHKDMKGEDLLASLLTLGFKYGEMDIFHRHQDSAGSGPVLFSVANMFNPGTFDIDQMDKLSTRGLSLFMTLPGVGEPLANFNLMHNAAKKLAEEFGGQVLDGQRSVLTVQTVRHYVEKIREFQRQQLIRG